MFFLKKKDIIKSKVFDQNTKRENGRSKQTFHLVSGQVAGQPLIKINK
jgi:hypothetical protein